MPLGIVDDSIFLAALQHDMVQQDNVTVLELRHGRGNVPEIPESLRKLIATDSIEGNGSGQEIADIYGVSKSSVSAYKNGSTSTTDYLNPNLELKNHVDVVKEKIISRSRSKLLMALKSITEDKLEAAKVRDLAGIAKDMSSVMKNMEPDAKIGININNQQVIVYKPRMKEEDDYEKIIINE